MFNLFKFIKLKYSWKNIFNVEKDYRKSVHLKNINTCVRRNREVAANLLLFNFNFYCKNILIITYSKIINSFFFAFFIFPFLKKKNVWVFLYV